MAVDADEFDAGRVQGDGQPSGPDSEIKNRRPGLERQVFPRPEIRGIGQARIQLRKPRIRRDRIVANPRLGDRLVGDVERLIDDRETLRQFLFVDAERRVRHDRVPANEGV